MAVRRARRPRPTVEPMAALEFRDNAEATEWRLANWSPVALSTGRQICAEQNQWVGFAKWRAVPLRDRASSA